MNFRPESAKYQIERFAAEGATARVYKARRLDSRGHSQQTVALKILKDRTDVPYLRHEFSAMTRVNSKFCVRVLAWENDGARSAVAMEWVDGITLEELARTFLLQPSHIALLVQQIYSGLRELERHGLHHGDLHPRNVLVDSEGRAKLIDFGSHARDENDVRGAAAYLAPERWLGEPSSFAADLFALGLIEIDLRAACRKSFSREEASRRCHAAVDSGSPLLRRLASERNYLDEPRENPQASQKELAAAVAERLVLKSTPIQTEVMVRSFEKQSVSALSFGIVWLTILMALSAPVRAEAPLIRTEQTATLEIRSLRWLELQLNGRPIGYAPVTLREIPAGSHRLVWRGPSGSGELRFDLTANTRLRLSEPELRRLSQSVIR